MKILTLEEIFALPHWVKVVCHRNGATSWIRPDLRDGEIYEAYRSGAIFELTSATGRNAFFKLNELSEHLVQFEPGKLTPVGWFELIEAEQT
jgi:hypothetical protein